MTPIGDRDRRIMFERVSIVDGDDGVEAESWTPLQPAWAMIMWGKGQERREAGALGAAITATFRVRSTSVLMTLTERDRIIDHRARIWNVTNVVEYGRFDLDISAIAKAS